MNRPQHTLQLFKHTECPSFDIASMREKKKCIAFLSVCISLSHSSFLLLFKFLNNFNTVCDKITATNSTEGILHGDCNLSYDFFFCTVRLSWKRESNCIRTVANQFIEKWDWTKRLMHTLVVWWPVAERNFTQENARVSLFWLTVTCRKEVQLKRINKSDEDWYSTSLKWGSINSRSSFWSWRYQWVFRIIQILLFAFMRWVAKQQLIWFNFHAIWCCLLILMDFV